jgi:hypothetical protein
LHPLTSANGTDPTLLTPPGYVGYQRTNRTFIGRGRNRRCCDHEATCARGEDATLLLGRVGAEMVEGRLHLMKVRMLASAHSFVFGAQKGSFIDLPSF